MLLFAFFLLQAHVSNQFLQDHLFVLEPVASGQHHMSPRVVHLALQVGAGVPQAVTGLSHQPMLARWLSVTCLALQGCSCRSYAHIKLPWLRL